MPEAKEETSLHEMKVGEWKWDEHHMVKRVPGGWLYETASYDKNTDEVTYNTSTFVPYNNAVEV